MKIIGMISKVMCFVVSIGVGIIVENAVKSTTPANISRFKKIFIYVGSFVLAGMVSDKAVQYTKLQISETVKSVKEGIGEEKVEN